VFSLSCPECTAQAVFSAMKSDHISPLLHELHWLRILDRIRFRLCVLVDRCLHGTAPTLSRRQPTSNRRRPRSSPSTLFRLGHVGRGTDEPFNTRRPCFPSGRVKSVEWLAFLSQSRFATVDVSSGTEDLSLPDKFTVTYTSAGRSSFLHILYSARLLDIC